MSPLLHTWLIARREYLENVRTRGFWIVILLAPLLAVLAIAAPLAYESSRPEQAYAIIDRSGWLLQAVTNAYGAEPADQQHFRRERDIVTEDQARAALGSGALFAYIVLPEDPLSQDATARYVSDNLTNQDLKFRFARLVNEQLRKQRLLEAQLSEQQRQQLLAELPFTVITRDASGAEDTAELSDTLHQWVPIVFVYALWMAIVAATQLLLTNTVEERSNKLVEVLLSSTSVEALLAGKVLGVAMTGLTMLSAWLISVGSLLLFTRNRLPVDIVALLADPFYLASFILYFVLGYLFYAAVLATIGALCDSLKEANNLLLPVQLLLVLPIIVMIPIARDPHGPLAAVLTWLPPLTPFVMMNRAAQPPEFWVYAGTTIVMMAAIYGVIRLAARVFKRSLLASGTPWALLKAALRTR